MSKENCGSHNLHKLGYSIQAFQTEDIQPPKCRFAALAPGDDEKKIKTFISTLFVLVFNHLNKYTKKSHHIIIPKTPWSNL